MSATEGLETARNLRRKNKQDKHPRWLLPLLRTFEQIRPTSGRRAVVDVAVDAAATKLNFPKPRFNLKDDVKSTRDHMHRPRFSRPATRVAPSIDFANRLDRTGQKKLVRNSQLDCLLVSMSPVSRRCYVLLCHRNAHE